MTNEIKPCPFCGDENIDTWDIRQEKYFCYCENCGCQGPTGKTEQEAIEAWNRRAGEEKCR